jgi:glycosyltransferase involved in cell wall biosynthesis
LSWVVEVGFMRILHCIASMEGGGAERQLTYLVRELVEQGCDVHVVLNHAGPNFSALKAARATVHQVGPLPNHDPRIFLALHRIISAIKPDICQCWLLQMELLGGLSSLLNGVPWIVSERSSANAYPRTLKNILRTTLSARADAIVSNSAAGDEYWRTRVPDGPPRYVVHNALPLHQIAAAPVSVDFGAGAQFGGPLVLWAGRLDAGKNAETVVRALAHLPAAARIHAVLCGEGPQRAHLEALVAELGLANRVRIAGYSPNLWSLMKRASVLVSASRFEGNPNVVLEAMAAECPLIVSDIAAHRELLDEESALFTPSDDVTLLASRIESAIRDREGARRRAAVARSRVDPYGVPQVAAAYLDIYRAVLSRRRLSTPVAL